MYSIIVSNVSSCSDIYYICTNGSTVGIFQLQVDLSHSKCLAILGQGNVALDIARLLLMPIDDLAVSKTHDCKYCIHFLVFNRIPALQGYAFK